MVDPSKKVDSTCTQECSAFKVEVRATGRPVELGGKLIGNDWVLLPTVRTLPYGTSFNDAADALTYTHDYYGAIALAASAMSAMRLDDIETRVVRFHRKITYELTREEELLLPGAVDRMFADAERARAARESERV